MKKSILFLILLLSVSGLFAEGQIMAINEKSDEEIIVLNQTSYSDSFKISVHLKARSFFSMKINDSVTEINPQEEEWKFLVKTPKIRPNNKWKSKEDFDEIEDSDSICIESKSGRKYSYQFSTKSDKLYITIKPYKETEEW